MLPGSYLVVSFFGRLFRRVFRSLGGFLCEFEVFLDQCWLEAVIGMVFGGFRGCI